MARLISNILNPFIVGAAVIIVLAFKDASGPINAINWALISLAVSVLPTFIVVAWLVRSKKMDGFFNTPRQQRYAVYILASALGAVGCGVLWLLDAPSLLAITFTVGLAEIVVFMVINYYWKISLHTAFAAAAVTVLIAAYGAVADWTVVLLPPIAWARIQLKQHSLAQVATGGLLAAAIAVGIFAGFGVIG